MQPLSLLVGNTNKKEKNSSSYLPLPKTTIAKAKNAKSSIFHIPKTL